MESTESILTSIKKLLGIEETYDQFDPDLIMDINAVFMILNQLGIGPADCFSISDKTSNCPDLFFEKPPKFFREDLSFLGFQLGMTLDPFLQL